MQDQEMRQKLKLFQLLKFEAIQALRVDTLLLRQFIGDVVAQMDAIITPNLKLSRVGLAFLTMKLPTQDPILRVVKALPGHIKTRVAIAALE